MSLKRKHSVDVSSPTSALWKSEPIIDRSSTFVALYSPTAPAHELQTYPAFHDASHRVAAWRNPSKQRSIQANGPRLYETGHEDDGEKYAGKKLEKLLEEQKVEGSVVVARWYGGILLGPVRFAHIENCAREAIQLWRASQRDNSGGSKARKVEGHQISGESKTELVETLKSRDQSITVLRNLLAEKKAGSRDNAASPSSTASPSRQLDYDSMPVQRLQGLEKARDATIAWLLKEIDQAEAGSKADAKTSETAAAEGTKTDSQHQDAEASKGLSQGGLKSRPQTPSPHGEKG